MTISPDLIAARRAGRKVIKAMTFVLGLVAIGAAYAAGNDLTTVSVVALVIWLCCYFSRSLLRHYCDYGLAFALVAQTAVITAAFAGHPWQVDSHMIYFASLAVTILLIKPKLLVMAATFIVAHHLVLSVTLPALVYPSVSVIDGVSRALFHGAVVGMETCVLGWSAHRIRAMVNAAHEDHAKLMDASENARNLAAKADTAHAEAREAQERAEREAERAQIALRKANDSALEMERAHAAMQQSQQRHDAQNDEAGKALAAVVTDLSDALAALAANQLDKKLERPFPPAYESIRADYNSAISALTGTISSVAAQIEALRGTAEAIAGTTKEQSTMSEVRSSALQEAAVSLRELTDSVGNVAKNASHASETVATSRSHADQAVQVLKDASGAMRKIHESADEIGSIVSLIEDIAFQTNLLSLNAGVEAARAGEAGRGFAVVATEVRALAARSSKSASEIKELITRSDHHVETGVALVDQSGDALMQILDLVARTDGEVQNISGGVHEQNTRLDAIARTLDGLSKDAQKDTAIIEETARAAANMNDVSDGLAETVNVFVRAPAPVEVPIPAEPYRAA